PDCFSPHRVSASEIAMLRLCCSLAVACLVVAPAVAQIDGIDREPINYKSAPAVNVITALQQRIDGGQAKLGFVDDHGYLPAVVRELNVPRSSQVILFSKTSFQRGRIPPKTPRGLYFHRHRSRRVCPRGA